MSMVEIPHTHTREHPAWPAPPAPKPAHAPQDLAALVGPDDARHIYARLADAVRAPRPTPRPAPPPPSHADADAPDTVAPADEHSTLNEVYVLALAAALQRAADAQPAFVEYRVRQVLRRLGLALDACTPFFIVPAAGA